VPLPNGEDDLEEKAFMEDDLGMEFAHESDHTTDLDEQNDGLLKKGTEMTDLDGALCLEDGSKEEDRKYEDRFVDEDLSVGVEEPAHSVSGEETDMAAGKSLLPSSEDTEKGKNSVKTINC
jgi:hypothetical protein